MARFLLTHAVSNAAEHAPDHPAVRCAGAELTYSELELASNRLARMLLENGLQRGDRVGIFMNKSLESAISLYGIMKAGGAYVPLDPFAPVGRVAYVVQNCGIRHLMTKEIKAGQVNEILAVGTDVSCVIGLSTVDAEGVTCIEWEQVQSAPAHPPAIQLTEQDLAYILYTSGSTGNPKGIMHTHRSGLSFAEWAAAEYGLMQDDRLSNHAPLHFDLSTFDFFAGSIAGATTVIIPEAITKFPANLSRLMADERISVWYSVPFALIQLMQRGAMETRDLSALRWLLFAGEVFPTKHLRELMQMLPGVRFSNLYGPTETNVCTYYHVPEPPQGDETIPIGRPCANVEDLVLDADDRPLQPGGTGELVIRGGVVMKGYWGQPDRNKTCFYRRRMFEDFEDLFYRTGDLVQLDENGNYRYFGRKDRQIKTRGYRVELDEVETGLLSSPAVQEAAVYPVPDGQGSNLIGAAVILKPGETLSESDLVEHLGARLPAYAIPAKIAILPDFPRTSTGKIDRRRLQEIASEEAGGQEQ